jgi:hypothetical protein
MSAASQKWNPPTFEVLPSAISSPELESGVTRCDLPDGPMTDLFGREVVLAQASQPQEKAKGLQTLATAGHIGHASSASAALQQSLESRLQQRLDTAGSTLFTLTWKRRRTPLGRSYLERAASVRRTSGSGCTSVPTPNTPSGGPNAKSTETHTGGMDLDGVATLSAVPTPTSAPESPASHGQTSGRGLRDLVRELSHVPSPCTPNGGRSMDPDKMDATGKTLDGRKHTASLEHAVKLGTVPTPMSGSPATDSYNAAGNNDYSRKMVELASVQTPTQKDHKSDGPRSEKRMRDGEALTSDLRLRNTVLLATVATPRSEDSQCTGAHRGTADTLRSQTNLASVASPSARDWKDTSGMSETGVDPDGSIRSRLDQLPRQAQLAASGPTATGGARGTGSTGQLNPAYSRWLMGLPKVWDWCALSLSKPPKRR